MKKIIFGIFFVILLTGLTSCTYTGQYHLFGQVTLLDDNDNMHEVKIRVDEDDDGSIDRIITPDSEGRWSIFLEERGKVSLEPVLEGYLFHEEVVEVIEKKQSFDQLIGLQEKSITFNNQRLEDFIRLKLQKESGDITGTELWEIIRLDLSQLAGTLLDYPAPNTLEGIQYLVNLEWVTLENGNIADLSPLSKLYKLETIELPYNEISDAVPLSDLKQMEHLNLTGNSLEDISFISNLENLKVLLFHDNEISNISSLSDLKELSELGLGGNKISDISSLAELENLENLNLTENNISDIEPLRNLSNLGMLNLSSNKIEDIRPLLDLDALYMLYISDNNLDLSEGSGDMEIINQLEERLVLIEY